MSTQKFYASPTDTLTYPNGAIGHRPGGSFDCLGPYAKVTNCPIHDASGLRLTCYATGYADTHFSVPACTRYRGKYVSGFFTIGESGVVFRAHDKHTAHLKTAHTKRVPKPGVFWFVEITDTFGGEANYSWAVRYKVQAKTARGAILKVNRDYGPYRLIKAYDTGETTRHNARGSCIAFFTSAWDDGHEHYRVKEI